MHCVYSDKHELRNPTSELYAGKLVAPFESPQRLSIILNEFKHRSLGNIIAPDSYSLDVVYEVHDRSYINFLQSCWDEWQQADLPGEMIPSCWPTRRMWSEQIPNHIKGKLGYYALAGETTICPGTWQALLAANDVVLTATSMVIKGEESIFALTRPPGHHAAYDQFGGYCFFNNAAIAAQYAINSGLKKVAILDVDYHHGNGTQDIFYNRDDVLFISIHCCPSEAFPYFLGYENEIGAKEGENHNANFPLMPGTNYRQWCGVLHQALEKIDQFNADLLVISLGVDTYEHDPISTFKFKHDDFYDYGKKLSDLKMKTLFLMEGGYAVKELGINTLNVLSGFEE